MERAIRKSKRGLAALNESINSTDDPELKAKLQSKFDRQSATLKQQEQRMNDFCEANDLIVRNDRVRVVGFGKGVSQRAVHGSKRYVKKQGGGSGTSGGTAAKKSKAETESKDKIQTLDYSTGTNVKPELIMSARVDKSDGSGIIDMNKKDLSKYVGKPIKDGDRQYVREWYVANVSNIHNMIDPSLPLEKKAIMAYELRNKFKRQARISMIDVERAELLDKKFPPPTFEKLLESKMNRKKMTRQEAIKDIYETAVKTNPDVNKEFNL